jgi:predicted transport protein
MEIYTKKNQKIVPLKQKPFKLERDIQKLVESNLSTLLNLQVVKSEFTVGKFRIDTLSFDTETNSFVIIEYKRDKNFSVIDQGFTYLSTVLENKGDLIIEYQEQFGKTVKKDTIDWSQTRVIFISQSFSDYQIESINFKDLPIELYEIRQYENDTITLNRYQSRPTSTSITEISKGSVITKVKSEIKVYSEDDVLRWGSEEMEELYQTFRERILNLGNDIEVKYTKLYVGFKRNKSNFVDITLRKKWLRIWLNQKWNTLDDSKKIFKDVSKTGHWGNGDYEIVVSDDKNLEYILSLIRQSYEMNG